MDDSELQLTIKIMNSGFSILYVIEHYLFCFPIYKICKN